MTTFKYNKELKQLEEQCLIDEPAPPPDREAYGPHVNQYECDCYHYNCEKTMYQEWLEHREILPTSHERWENKPLIQGVDFSLSLVGIETAPNQYKNILTAVPI